MCKDGPRLGGLYVINYHGTGVCRKLDGPLDTVTKKECFGLVEPKIVGEGEKANDAQQIARNVPHHVLVSAVKPHGQLQHPKTMPIEN